MTKPVVIIGGGAIGSSIACFLSSLDPARRVIVIERDPTYVRASSALSTSSLRQQFSTPVNIQLSQFGYQFMSESAETTSYVSLMPRGYLFLAQAHQEAELRERTKIARSYGAKLREYDPIELNGECPWMNVADLTYAVRGLEGEGWFDGYSLMQLYRARARASGVTFYTGEAVGFESNERRVDAILLGNGSRLEVDQIVNAAGPWAGELATKLGLNLPVKARRRTAFMVSCPTVFENFPILMDTTGVYVRPEQKHFILNASPAAEADFDDLPLDPDFTVFEDVMWPALAERIPAFEALRVERAWAGYYEFNDFDHNGWVGKLGFDNHYVATGFSGHGLMHSAGVGRGMAELLTYGGFKTLDLSALDPLRLERGQPIVEKGVY